MKNSLAEAGIISEPKSFAVGKRHLTKKSHATMMHIEATVLNS